MKSGAPDAGGAAILVVDDDADMRRLLCDLLEQAGYTTREAATGDEALRLAREELPRLVLLDVRLPGGVSGREVCRELRADVAPNVPIILLSGEKIDALDRAAGLDLGADDYVVKPFDVDELLARVRALIRRSRSNRRAAAASGLTSRELEVLRLLASGRRPDEIAIQLGVTPRTVRNHIEHILAKLGCHSRAEAVGKAYRDHLLEVSD